MVLTGIAAGIIRVPLVIPDPVYLDKVISPVYGLSDFLSLYWISASPTYFLLSSFEAFPVAASWRDAFLTS